MRYDPAVWGSKRSNRPMDFCPQLDPYWLRSLDQRSQRRDSIEDHDGNRLHTDYRPLRESERE